MCARLPVWQKREKERRKKDWIEKDERNESAKWVFISRNLRRYRFSKRTQFISSACSNASSYAHITLKPDSTTESRYSNGWCCDAFAQDTNVNYAIAKCSSAFRVRSSDSMCDKDVNTPPAAGWGRANHIWVKISIWMASGGCEMPRMETQIGSNKIFGWKKPLFVTKRNRSIQVDIFHILSNQNFISKIIWTVLWFVWVILNPKIFHEAQNSIYWIARNRNVADIWRLVLVEFDA